MCQAFYFCFILFTFLVFIPLNDQGLKRTFWNEPFKVQTNRKSVFSSTLREDFFSSCSSIPLPVVVFFFHHHTRKSLARLKVLPTEPATTEDVIMTWIWFVQRNFLKKEVTKQGTKLLSLFRQQASGCYSLNKLNLVNHVLWTRTSSSSCPCGLHEPSFATTQLQSQFILGALCVRLPSVCQTHQCTFEKPHL